MLMRRAWITAGLITCLLQACSMYQKPVVPEPAAPEKFKYAKSQVAYHSPLRADWWKNFNDQHLNELVAKSLQKNLDYQVALKNIDIARTYISQNTSMLWPQVNVSGNLSRNRSINLFNTGNDFDGSTGTNSGLPNPNNLYNFVQLFASVSYELDVWNQIGNSIHQAQADTVSSAAASQVVKLTILNSVVDGYYQLAALNDNISNLSSQRRIASEILKLTKVRYRAGLVNGSAVEDAKNQLETIKSSLNNAKKQRGVTLSMLAYLTGEYPESFMLRDPRGLKQSGYARLLPPALPSRMLIERPDIQQAYYQVVSTGYIEKQSYAGLFPSFMLTGSFGYANQSLSKFISSNNQFWNYGLNMTAPIFDYQLTRSVYNRAKLQYENAMLNYKKVVLNAFKEVDSALITYQQDSQALYNFQNIYTQNKAKLSIADAQYRSGLTDYNNYLALKLVSLQSQYSLTNQRLLVLQDILQTYKALGVGFNA